jgi:hypothetical protein
MTAQIAEKISIDGETFAMCTEPLADYFELGGKRLQFAATCTALWRGYVGHWELLNDRLYLVGLSGTLEDGTEASLANIFPEYPLRVFAHWYSGKIRLPQGKLLNYVHGGYASTYERDQFITFDRGVVVARNTTVNGVAIGGDDSEGYEIAAMTTFPIRRKSGKEAD